MNLTYDMVAELKEIPNVKGIKEASGDISQIASIAQLVDDEFLSIPAMMIKSHQS